tara:strand:+ start:1220 stop:1429 length:210 start_codon:yes stop_codon:yes gene_type:complete
MERKFSLFLTHTHSFLPAVSSNFIAVRKTKQGVEYEKKVKLLEFLKFKAGDVVYFEDVGGIVLATARCN